MSWHFATSTAKETQMTVQRSAGNPVRSSLAILAIAFAAFAPPVLAQSTATGGTDRSFHSGGEGWMPAQAEGSSGATRAEVASDLDLWIRSGMAALVQSEPGIDLNSPESQRRFADYSAMRADRAYASGQQGTSGEQGASDLDLWIVSGMAALVQAEPGLDLNSSEYQRRFALYSAMRAERASASAQRGTPDEQVATRPVVQRKY
jgi:hypothetical protein